MNTYFEEHKEPLSQRIAVGLAKLSLALRHRAWRQAPRSLTPTQGQVLTALARRPGLTLGQVAEALAVRAPTASDAVATLERKGLVEKTRRPDDARVLALTLTSEGRRIAEQADRWPDFLAAAIDDLADDEQRVLLRTLLTLIRTLQQRGEISPAAMCISCRYFRPCVHDDPRRAHHCALVDAAFGDADLRLDCPEHEPAAGEALAAAWQRLTTAR